MDGASFDQITRTLTSRSLRRNALKALAGGGLALALTAGPDRIISAKRRRKRCRKAGATCGGQKKCCSKGGPLVCQPFISPLCEGVDLIGNRCCGLEGAKCDPTFGTSLPPHDTGAHGNCSCCAPLYCGEQLDGEFRCQVEVT